MRIPIKISALIIMVSIGMSACKKDVEEIEPEDPTIPSYPILIDTNALGAAIIRDFNQSLGVGFQGSKDLYVDIDQNSLDDFIISRTRLPSVWGLSTDLYIKTLDSNLKVASSIDYRKLIRYKIYNSFRNDTTYYAENYDPTKEYPSDFSIEALTYTVPVAFEHGESLSEPLLWESGNLTFARSQHTGVGRPLVHVASISYEPWKSLQNKLVVIKYNDGMEDYIGWIQIELNGEVIEVGKMALWLFKEN